MKKKLLRETNPDIFSMIKNQDLYYNIGIGFTGKIEFTCPRCGSIVSQRVNNTVRCGLSCKKCGDGISFGEKFIFNVLEQLHIDFEMHVKFDWSDYKIYDIGIYDNGGLIGLIEVHGEQHYGKDFSTCGGRSQQQEVDNDAYKYKLAIENGVASDMYIVIDCRTSSLEYIKSSIEAHTFFQKYNLQYIDWSACLENATSSYVVKAWRLWELGHNIGSIAKQLKINRFTVRRYLQQGAKTRLCSYSVEESIRRRADAIKSTEYKSFYNREPKTLVVSPQLKQIFYSVRGASIQTNICKTSIYDCLSGKQRYAGTTQDGVEITWSKIIYSELNDFIINGFVLIKT